jgi:hypothetical protein
MSQGAAFQVRVDLLDDGMPAVGFVGGDGVQADSGEECVEPVGVEDGRRRDSLRATPSAASPVRSASSSAPDKLRPLAGRGCKTRRALRQQMAPPQKVPVPSVAPILSFRQTRLGHYAGAAHLKSQNNTSTPTR